MNAAQAVRRQISKRPLECAKGGFYFGILAFWIRLRGWWKQYKTDSDR